MSSSLPILIAIPDEWNSQVCEHLEKLGFLVVATYSEEETLAMLQKLKDFRGIVIVSDWAMTEQNSDPDGIVKLVRGKIPTVTLITETSRRQSGYRYMDEVFFPPSHDYITTPFSLEELVARMRHVGIE